MDKVLLHSCCAPCSVYCIDTLRGEGIEPTSLWFNPNIHPYQEYKARRDTLLAYGESIGVAVNVLEDYGLREFVRAVADDIDHRCAHCYTIRLGTAAKYASEHGYQAFTSSLLISPYQNHELLKAVLGSVFCRRAEPDGVAVRAAVADVGGNGFDEFAQTVILQHVDRHADACTVSEQRVAPRLVFLIGVDVGVEPKARRLDPLTAQCVDAVHRAGRTAAMQQNLVHGNAPCHYFSTV